MFCLSSETFWFVCLFVGENVEENHSISYFHLPIALIVETIQLFFHMKIKRELTRIPFSPSELIFHEEKKTLYNNRLLIRIVLLTVWRVNDPICRCKKENKWLTVTNTGVEKTTIVEDPQTLYNPKCAAGKWIDNGQIEERS